MSDTNVAVYARVSTDKQDSDNQLIQLRAFAAKQGWNIVAEYVDTVSGSGKEERPQFKRMMLDASQRKFDLLLFWKLDRLSREGTPEDACLPYTSGFLGCILAVVSGAVL